MMNKLKNVCSSKRYLAILHVIRNQTTYYSSKETQTTHHNEVLSPGSYLTSVTTFAKQ